MDRLHHGDNREVQACLLHKTVAAKKIFTTEREGWEFIDYGLCTECLDTLAISEKSYMEVINLEIDMRLENLKKENNL